MIRGIVRKLFLEVGGSEGLRLKLGKEESDRRVFILDCLISLR